MPGSVVDLYILEHRISGETKVPLLELQNAMIGQKDFVHLEKPAFIHYFQEHIRATAANTLWTTQIDSVRLSKAKDTIVGLYQEVIVYFQLIPSNKIKVRDFLFNYDAVVHQVLNHKILVYVQQDWYNGVQTEAAAIQAGIIEYNTITGVIQPLPIHLGKGNFWKGLFSMVQLGMKHIREGEDHLLFVFVLLLPSMLVIERKRWMKYGGIVYASKNLLRIVTAFTIGHSITLFIGANQWIQLPPQPVEVLIAFSILISAVHAIRPIFYQKEIYIAAFFGLIHGLAFATVLYKLKLSSTMLLWSILGFNIGIELMQLIIIACTMPIMILFARTKFYTIIRLTSAGVSATLAIIWMIERMR